MKKLIPACISIVFALSLCTKASWVQGQITITADTTQGCAPMVVNFSNTSAIGTTYYWYFGDGNGMYFLGTDTSYTYSNPGYYYCTLYAYDSVGNYMGSNYVAIDVLSPITSFYQSATNVCPGTNVHFNSYYSGNSFAWDFGDGNTASGQWANHTYTVFGSYTVTLIADGLCGIDTITQTISVDSSGTANADFGYWPNNVCPGLPVNFYAYEQSAVSYSWDFGDGSNSNQASPNYSYSNTGNYTVTCIVTNGCGNSDTTIQNIDVENNSGFPSWTSINTPSSTACPGEEVNFSGSGGYLAYVKDPGDGSPADSSSSSELYHTYSDTGTYVVSFTIYNHCGNDTTVYDTIVISNNLGFENTSIALYTESPICPGAEAYASVNGAFYSYLFDFGDGSPSILNYDGSANHIYANAGSYTVSATVTNHCGIDTTISSTIDVLGNYGFDPNNTDFYHPSEKCPGSEFYLFAASDHASYIWDFGNGFIDTSYSSYKTYSYGDTGTYNISVTITNHCGNDTTLFGSVFIGNNVGFPNTMDFYTHPNPVCPNDKAGLDTEQGYASYSWDFGDGTTATTGTYYAKHYYDTASTYSVSVTITNGCGFDTTLYSAIAVDDNAGFPDYLQLDVSSPVMCPGDQIEFYVDEDYNQYSWDMGDGTTFSGTSHRVNHSYDSSGTYQVSVVVTNGCGNQITLTKSIIVDANNSYVDPTMQVLSNQVCPGDVFSLFADSDFSPYTYVIDFGDGNIDTTYGTGTSHSYDSVGSYLINITALNGCGYSNSYSLIMDVSNTAGFSSQLFYGVANEGNFAGCPGDNILFFFMGTYSNTFDFGDGSTATATETVQTPQGEFTVITHTYGDTGTYVANLTLTNACGNTSNLPITVKIGNGLQVEGQLYAEPPQGAANYTTCSGVSFLAFGGSDYDWDFGDGTTQSSLSPKITHYYSNPGSYQASVTISNGCGNSLTTSINVNVLEGGGATISGNVISPPSCNGYSDAIASVSGSGGTQPYTFLWDDASSTTSSIATGLSAEDYSVTVTDANACSGTANITIPETPLISGVGTTVQPNCGQSDGSIILTGVSGGTTPYTYAWDNGDDTPTADSLTAGTYSLTITDFAGCSNSQSIVLSNNAGASISSYTINDVSCNGGSDGSADITVTGGTTPYSFNWSTGATTEDISGVAEGTYVITITDADGCTQIQSGSVGQPDPIEISTSIVDANCGVADGSITASATGGTSPYSYSWSTGSSTNQATALVAGAYNLTVTDGNSCIEQNTIMVSNANSPVISELVTDVSCNGNGDGSIDLTITGGTTPYTYLWLHDGSFTQDINGLDAGAYTLILNDGSGCQTAKTIDVNEPEILTSSSSSTGSHCGYDDGTGEVTVSGGTIPYTYSWSSGGTDSVEIGLALGSYGINITDANGCTTSESIDILAQVDPQPICIVTVDSVTSSKNLIIWEKPTNPLGIESYYIYRDSLGVYVLIGSQSFATESQYIDSSANIDPNITSYRYKISAVDSCGNESELSDHHETIHALITPNAGEVDMVWDNYEGFGFCCYNIMRDSTGLDQWEQIDQVSNNNFTYTDLNPPLGNIRYRIDIIPPSACNANKVKTYNTSKSNTSSAVFVALAASTSSTMVSQQGACDGTATATATGGTPAYTYLWSDPALQTTATAVGLCEGNYSVIVTDSKGNIVSASVVVEAPPPPVGIKASFLEENSLTVAPNPYSGKTQLSYSLEAASKVMLEVYNYLGERIAIIVNEDQNAGEYNYDFGASTLGYPNGMYLLKFSINENAMVKRIVELK